MTPVNSVEIPERFVRLCHDWYGGQGCMLYAVSSTGGLTTGTIRPHHATTDEKWYLTLWRDLAVSVYWARRAAGDDQVYPGGDADLDAICEFEEWVDGVVDQLSEEYGLENWEN